MINWSHFFLAILVIISPMSCKKNTEIENSEVQSKVKSSESVLFLGQSLHPKSVEYLRERIYENEAKRNPEYLVFWSEREDFPSLGIAHWIWFPQFSPNYDKSSLPTQEDSFPGLLRFIASEAPKLGIKIPAFLTDQNGQIVLSNPFKNRSDFLTRAEERNSLKKLLMDTLDLQTQYLIISISDKVERAIKLKTSGETEYRRILLKIVSSPMGLYPIFDYVNFKGDGTDTTWGLLQVLDRLKGEGNPTVNHFAQACKETLEKRVAERQNDKKFLNGWILRCNSYR
jgi:hypothetical protein